MLAALVTRGPPICINSCPSRKSLGCWCPAAGQHSSLLTLGKAENTVPQH